MEERNRNRNPSRETCEDIIKRILMTEVLEKGTNEHFRTAADFMNYFESLYPASDSLTKQVQRAVRALQMPKDAKGYFIINKTGEQLDQDHDLALLLQKTSSRISSLDECETLFLKVPSTHKDYLLQLIHESITFQDKYVTIVNSDRGFIFYTRNKVQLEVLLESLIQKS